VADHVTIRIEPSGVGSTSLTVEDALQQVLDYVDLLRAADLSEGKQKVIWLLHSASTNSPLEVTASATGPDPSVPVGYQARQNVERVSSAVRTLEAGRGMPTWMEGEPSRIAERFFKRNTNGIGRTSIALEDAEPVTIVHATARKAALTIEKARIEKQLAAPDWTRTEFGSVEGEIISTTSYYSKPALVIKERLSGANLNCILSQELADQVGPTHSWDETWQQKRFLISGELHYGSDGGLKKVDATALTEVLYGPVDLDEIRDMKVLDGEQPHAAIERLWDGG
jgi:hypothetical protein